jgi:hypothetical protein
MNSGRYPTDEILLPENRHDKALVSVVDVPVTGIVVNERVAIANPDGGNAWSKS